MVKPCPGHATDEIRNQQGTHYLTAEHPLWPELWREMPDPPQGVFVRGGVEVLGRPAIAMVGTRSATSRGMAVAHELARGLASVGWVVVSGLARGIDGAAHRGALSMGGISVGVMATGLDRTYPADHEGLRCRLEVKGCCLTEFPEGKGPRKYHFPRRNRLIAGMVRGVIVVEAPLKSGAMVTAYQALDYNREVFAVPGPIDVETSRGCHHLLKEGANLLERVEDVHRVLDPPAEAPDQAVVNNVCDGSDGSSPGSGSAARWILDRLDLEGVSRDELRFRWPGSEAAWAEGMLALELGGLIRRLPGGRLARRMWNP